MRLSAVRASQSAIAHIVSVAESKAFPGIEVQIEKAASTKKLRFPFAFLRDNCASNFHQHTLQRLTAMNPEVLSSHAKSFAVRSSDNCTNASTRGGLLSIEWANKVANQKESGKFLSPVSTYSPEWLLEHSLERRCREERLVEQYRKIQRLTAHDFHNAKPYEFSEVLADKHVLVDLMDRLWSKGLVYITGVPGEIEDKGAAVGRFVDSISYIRQTNYGRLFEVYAQSNPNNQAYTNQLLPLHTDLPFYRHAPDVQMLHCVANSAKGGLSWFIDGVGAVLELQRTHPRLYEVLATKKVQFSDKSAEFHLLDEKEIIQEKRIGDQTFVHQVFFNEGVRCHVLNSCEPEEVNEFYQAMIELQKIFDSNQELRVEFKLDPGSMVVFNNNRVLHGRGQFSAPSAASADGNDISRYLIGAYVDWDDFHSKRRVLSVS